MKKILWYLMLPALASWVLVGVYALLPPDWIFPAYAESGVDPETPSNCSPDGLINLYCSGCHASGRSKVDLVAPSEVRILRRDRGMWEKVIEQIRTEHMPPKGFPQPVADERAAMIRWIEEGLNDEGSLHGRVFARRITKAEYRNTLRDLLGIEVPADADLPDDDLGWDRLAAVPDVSADLLEKYTAAADQVLAPTVVAGVLKAQAARHDREAPLVMEATACADGANPLPSVRDAGEHARYVVGDFARRAYRRPLREDEAKRIFEAALPNLSECESVDQLILAGMKRVLTSPHFLFHIETMPDPESDAPFESDQLALASRLASLLWSSAPDEELLEAAERGLLLGKLEAQARRMLRDPRSAALTATLADRWLELTKLQERMRLDDALESAMRQETKMFVEGIVQGDRSVLEFLDADYTYLNEPLARHYGIPGVEGEQMRRVTVTGSVRGGLLTQGSLLRVSSSYGDTNLVLRGKWIMDNLLGTPPPPPPAGLLEAFKQTRSKFDKGTPRQVLAQHRENASCAHCHGQMDSLGAAMENLDWNGTWRTSYATTNEPIDSVVVLPTGERLDGPGGVKAFLLAKRDLFVRCLAGKLLGFSLVRPLNEYDHAALDESPTRVAGDGHRFSSILFEVIRSEPFLKGAPGAAW